MFVTEKTLDMAATEFSLMFCEGARVGSVLLYRDMATRNGDG